MPLNDKKIISVLRDQCEEQIKERCDGYKQEVAKAICVILDIERRSQDAPAPVSEKIERIDKVCNRLTSVLIDGHVDVASAVENAE